MKKNYFPLLVALLIVLSSGKSIAHEINVTGNTYTIVNGNSVPTTTYGTIFTTTNLGTPVTKTYTIQNTGTGDLLISGITITGLNAAEFSVTTAPSDTVAPSSSTTFVVTLDATVGGSRTAIINIMNNDTDESLYSFTVKGGVRTIDNEINVKGNNVSIYNGNNLPSTTYGTLINTNIGTQVNKTYTIQNTGTQNLTITGVTITGTNASEFTVTTAPSGTVMGGSSTTFVITFDATVAGNRTAIINIMSDDVDEDVYTFTVKGNVLKLTNTISMASIPNKYVDDMFITVSASATNGGMVTFSGSNAAIATVTAGGMITPVSEGTIYVYAYQAGDATYSAVTLTKTFKVIKRSQTITWSAIAAKTVTSNDFMVSAMASSGLTTITYSIVSGPATITGNMVHLLGTGGTVTLRATQAGNNIYSSKFSNKSFTVSKASQTISWTMIPSKTTSDPDFMVSAIASSGLTVTYGVVSGPATISGSTVHLTGLVGTVKLRATQAGNATYSSKTADITFTVASAFAMLNNNLRVYHDNEETTSDLNTTIHITIFPNPSDGLLTISQNEIIQEIVVFDILGNNVMKLGSEGSNSTSLDLSDLAKGIYYVRIKSNNNFSVEKVILK